MHRTFELKCKCCVLADTSQEIVNAFYRSKSSFRKNFYDSNVFVPILLELGGTPQCIFRVTVVIFTVLGTLRSECENGFVLQKFRIKCSKHDNSKMLCQASIFVGPPMQNQQNAHYVERSNTSLKHERNFWLHYVTHPVYMRIMHARISCTS